MADLVVITKYFKDLIKTKDGYYDGYVDGTATYDQFITELYAAGYSYFIRDSDSKKTGGGNFVFSSNRLSSYIPVPFCGSPFQCVKNTAFECSHGIIQFSAKKYATTKELDGHSNPKKKRLHLQPSKKIGCSAKMRTKCIRIYPDYKVFSDDHSRWKLKREVTDQLKEDLKSSNPPRSILRYYIRISEAAHHCHSATSPMRGERLHPQLKSEIWHLVKKNITSTGTIKEYLHDFVEIMFKNKSKPEETNSVFYPSDKIIRNYIYAAQMKLSKMDQGNHEKCQATTYTVDEFSKSFEQCTSSGDEVSISNDMELVDYSPLVLISENDDSESPAKVVSDHCSDDESDFTDTNGFAMLRTVSGEECLQQCRKKLQEIRNLTYLCNERDEDVQILLFELTTLSERLTEKVRSTKVIDLEEMTGPFFKGKNTHFQRRRKS